MENNKLEIIEKKENKTLFYSNKLNEISPFSVLSLIEGKVFAAACYMYQQEYWDLFQEMPVEKIEKIPKAKFSYKTIKELANYKGKSNKRFEILVNEMADNLQSLRGKWELPGSTETEKNIRRADVFPVIDTLETTKEVVFYGNIAFLQMLFDLDRYTAVELKEIRSLHSKYSIRCYCQLKQWRSTGYWIVNYEHFKRLMGIEEKWREDSSYIEKNVLEKIRKELSKYFKDLNIEKPKDKGKKGQPIKNVIFRFRPEFVKKEERIRKSPFVCKKCGQPLYEMEINGVICWAHKDGAKDDAICSLIYNSPADIMGYEETPQRLSDEERHEYTEMMKEKLKKAFPDY